MWQQWVNTILGLWVIAIPFVGMTAASMVWTLVITGAVIAILGLWGAGVEATERTHMQEMEAQLRHQH